MGPMLPVFLIVAAGIYLAITMSVAAARRADYSHRRHTISELGEKGARDGLAVSLGVFLPVGLATAAAALLAGATWPVAGPAGAIAAGYLVASLFPCDPGSPFSGTGRQAIHNAGGGVQYVGGVLALLTLGDAIGAPFRWAGFAVFAALLFISFPGPYRGLAQRVAETVLFAAAAAALYRHGIVA